LVVVRLGRVRQQPVQPLYPTMPGRMAGGEISSRARMTVAAEGVIMALASL
jgi:hypothetical protein